jgi:23S rRNA pseudoU1915 N3-methylase RlmH
MQEEAQRQAQLAQYNDELARKRQQAEHELQRQRNGELVSLQEQAAARKEAERLRIEQQIQAERRAADQHAVRGEGGGSIVQTARVHPTVQQAVERGSQITGVCVGGAGGWAVV